MVQRTSVLLCDYTERMPSAVKSSSVRRQPGKPLPPAKRAPKVEAPWSLRTVRSLQILELAPFRKFPWLVHGFSTRGGGASALASGERVLNLSFTEWDTREVVRKNRE